MIFLIMFIPMSPVSVWVIEKKGIRSSLIIGLTISAVGMWVRTFINKGFIWVMIG